MATTFDARIWKLTTYEGARGTSHVVRWVVAGRPRRQTFRTEALADSFRANLVTAARKGDAFDIETGLPMSLAIRASDVAWFSVACAYMDAKWPSAAATYRRSISEALTAITPALLDNRTVGKPDDAVIRRALHRWAFNTARRDDPERPAEISDALRWIARHSVPIARLAEPSVLRGVLVSTACNLDGSRAAGSVAGKRKRVLYNALEYAVEEGFLEVNPLVGFKWVVPKSPTGVDKRCVVNPIQARTLLHGVHDTPRSGPFLVAFFALMYFSALRPEEAVNLRKQNLALPKEGWGEMYLEEAAPHAGSDWTDDREQRERRPLKNRARGQGRTVPSPPELTAILHHHMATFGFGLGGRLFRGERSDELPKLTYMRTWRAARRRAFTEEVVASSLAATPYTLRHACVSTWLNGGVPATQVAEWAGHSVEVLLRFYAKCVDGQQELARRRISAALGHSRETSR